MRWVSRSIIPAAVALAALVSFFPRSGPTIELRMTEFRFTPQVLELEAGDSVALVNDGKATHSFECLAQQQQGSRGACGVSPGDVQPGLTEVVKFAAAGQYDFFCRYHASRGMVGRLVVRGSGEPAPPPSPPATSPATSATGSPPAG